jgi:hypothetical protein
LLLIACGDGVRAAAASGETDPRLSPGYVVDSARSMEEELRRFRGDAAASPDTLAFAHDSKESLVGSFLSALLRGDSAGLAQLHVTRAEFGDLYFPYSRFMRPPYELPPALLWFQLTSESNRGLTKLMRLFTNRELVVDRVECPEEPVAEGDNRLWNNCRTFLRGMEGPPGGWRLFGSIIERHGRVKFLSYANDL